MQLKIGSGKFKGRVIHSPNTKQTRVTTSLHRKVIFDSLQFSLENAHVLDLFAGSGILGLEALSKGASFVTFVDIGAKQIATIKKNIALLDLNNQCTVLKKDALALLEKNSFSSFDIILLDPPYTLSFDKLCSIFDLIEGKILLKEDGVICLETTSTNVKNLQTFFTNRFNITKERIKGETALLFIENHRD